MSLTKQDLIHVVVLGGLLSVILSLGFYMGYVQGSHTPPAFLILKHGSFVSVGGVFFSYGLNQWADQPTSEYQYNVQITAADSTYSFNSTVKQGDILTFPRWGQYRIEYMDNDFISVELVK